ncbi:guanine(37)-N1-methyltransferase [Polychytrium aggregatum]|uniref:guanine(37)-N1-methyltransferase n=1 Tax=Polychytrium aggregatum TaxID=110093 RepID=UPI0022FDCA4F|nr:guanine(37)-N1-methyltransferase [Polychytrium aggregatum]KAI9204908.1 guanine(37)-N1-methyltransferase [Polychytrium aggregatum]
MSSIKLLAPPTNKGIKTLEKLLFKRSIELAALRVDVATCPKVLPALEGSLLNIPKLRHLIEDPQDLDWRDALVCTDAVVSLPDIDSLPDNVKQFALSEKAELVTHSVELDYDYWSADQILRSILPDDLEVPSAFEMVGHIAHLNLREQHMPYKNIIGQVIIDKHKYIKTVVNKLDSIDHTFRFFKMEVLAGEDNFVTEMKEGGCRFQFDYSKVYWNSRLQGEHERLVKSFGSSDLICDVMAGVGPFAVPAAKTRGAVVFANDLNPDSYSSLVGNVGLNRVGHLVRPYNMDGRAFIRQSLTYLNDPAVWEEFRKNVQVKRPARHPKIPPTEAEREAERLAEVQKTKQLHPPEGFKIFHHYVMNLPATAIEFLDAFRGLLHGKENIVPDDKLPIVHVHCFSKAEDLDADVIERAEHYLGASIKGCVVNIHRVRDVAPKKEMLCLSFRIPPAVAYADPAGESRPEEAR